MLDFIVCVIGLFGLVFVYVMRLVMVMDVVMVVIVCCVFVCLDGIVRLKFWMRGGVWGTRVLEGCRVGGESRARTRRMNDVERCEMWCGGCVWLKELINEDVMCGDYDVVVMVMVRWMSRTT